MSISNGPNVVKTNLALNLDAISMKSYAGTGTTWSDVSGSGNHVTLNDATAYNANGYMSSAVLGTKWHSRQTLLNGFSTGAVTAFSFCALVRVTDATTTQFFSFDDLGSDTTGRLNYYLSGTGHLTGENNNNFGIVTSLSSSVVSTNNWYFYGATLSGLTHTFYRGGTVNGFEVDLPTTLASSPTIGSYFLLGRRGFDVKFGGDIACFQMYNRALSSVEILQNFAAIRGRFGL